MILNEFLPKYVHCNGRKLSGVSEDFSFILGFFGFKNAKINFLMKISVLSAVLSNSSTGDWKPA